MTRREEAMSEKLRLMAIVAHPDDESMALGGTLVSCAAQGIETSVIMATRGERGWFGYPDVYPGPTALGQMREQELRMATRYLGVADLAFLDYVDGELSNVADHEATAKLVTHLRRFRPNVVVTFGPEGIYGHPDHIAISQLATAAVMCSADPHFNWAPGVPHRVDKLYYRVFTQAESAKYLAAFGDVAIDVDGIRRSWTSWPEWSVTTRLDTSAVWPNVWSAVRCHLSQLPNLDLLTKLPYSKHRDLWGQQQFYRVTGAGSDLNGIETDLFAGLRHSIDIFEPSVSFAQVA
jgi:LmbE family N-acetylglucosaminyl deacetylase